jgi:hypothetical protein
LFAGRGHDEDGGAQAGEVGDGLVEERHDTRVVLAEQRQTGLNHADALAFK